jgi:hypothetical protein
LINKIFFNILVQEREVAQDREGSDSIKEREDVLEEG